MISDPEEEKHLVRVVANEFIVFLIGLKVFVDGIAFLAANAVTQWRPAEVKALFIV
jgi:hypothetical protein